MADFAFVLFSIWFHGVSIMVPFPILFPNLLSKLFSCIIMCCRRCCICVLDKYTLPLSGCLTSTTLLVLVGFGEVMLRWCTCVVPGTAGPEGNQRLGQT
jgi:hypothetical protein